MLRKCWLLVGLLSTSHVYAANEPIVEPFGSFQWGDGYGQAIKKLCSYDFDSFSYPFKATKQQVCDHTDFSFISLDVLAVTTGKQTILAGAKWINSSAFEFDGVRLANGSAATTQLVAEGINLLGAKYSIELRFGMVGEERLKGAYLAYKPQMSEYFVDGKVIYSPLLLNKMVFKPLDTQQGVDVQAKLYETLREKYLSYDNVKADSRSNILVVQGGEKSYLEFSRRLTYSAGQVLNNKAMQALTNYNKQQAQDNINKDVSSEL